MFKVEVAKNVMLIGESVEVAYVCMQPTCTELVATSVCVITRFLASVVVAVTANVEDKVAAPVKVEAPPTVKVPAVASMLPAEVVISPAVTILVLMVVTAFAVRVMTSTPNITARMTEIIFVILSLLTMFILT